MLITVVGMQYTIINWNGVFTHCDLIDKTVKLIKEPDNKYDKNAIAVYKDDLHLGYISRDTQKNVDINKKYTIGGVSFHTLGLMEV